MECRSFKELIKLFVVREILEIEGFFCIAIVEGSFLNISYREKGYVSPLTHTNVSKRRIESGMYKSSRPKTYKLFCMS